MVSSSGGGGGGGWGEYCSHNGNGVEEAIAAKDADKMDNVEDILSEISL